VLLGSHNFGVWCCSTLDGFCLVLLLGGGLFLVILDKVGNIWCCSPISQIFGAGKKSYYFSLVLPEKLTVSVWCCNQISKIFGAVKESNYLSLVLLMNYITFFCAVTKSLFYKMLLLN
jgi:hypothetical protein